MVSINISRGDKMSLNPSKITSLKWHEVLFHMSKSFKNGNLIYLRCWDLKYGCSTANICFNWIENGARILVAETLFPFTCITFWSSSCTYNVDEFSVAQYCLLWTVQMKCTSSDEISLPENKSIESQKLLVQRMRGFKWGLGIKECEID